MLVSTLVDSKAQLCTSLHTWVQQRHEMEEMHVAGQLRHLKAKGEALHALQTLVVQLAAKKSGYADVLYLDAKTDTYLEEVSSCNIFTVKGNKITTPPLQVCAAALLPFEHSGARQELSCVLHTCFRSCLHALATAQLRYRAQRAWHLFYIWCICKVFSESPGHRGRLPSVNDESHERISCLYGVAQLKAAALWICRAPSCRV